MARIYDNIETKFMLGLQDIVTNIGVKRVDFCVGYFNLRGWELVVNQIDQIPGDFVYENDKQEFRCCRLLIGMHQPDEELVRRLYSKPQIPDANYVQQCKLEIARDFRKQLLLGNPTKKDEWTLRRLSAQLKDDKVCVKLYVAGPLHAKLYLAHRPDDNLNKVTAILGSSNLTLAGLTKQGELDAFFIIGFMYETGKNSHLSFQLEWKNKTAYTEDELDAYILKRYNIYKNRQSNNNRALAEKYLKYLNEFNVKTED